ncbi:MAG: NADH-quinone oxidoreductase subunit NuoE [Treponema sp.]|jgi:NADH-quinone oxidoreductase subunit E|nr:NADH-quinone oxidoreductase subunit NuoE [Treponema sp.]
MAGKGTLGKNELIKLVEAYPKNRRFSLAILQDIQREFGHIPREAFGFIAQYLNVKTAELYSMATFYRALSLKPKGKHVIRVCDGTACHIRGAPVLLDSLKRALGIGAGETTEDGLFTIETVNCLGACAIAPVMVVDNQYYPKVKPDKVDEILNEFRKASGGPL